METEFVFITANDIHISDNNPRSRIDDFKATMLNKLSQMSMACNKLNADGAIIAGDIFNIKSPTKNSHRQNRELVKVFNSFKCPIFMIEGNHDLTGGRLDSLEEQPLGVLFEDKTLIQLRHEIIEKNGIKVSLVGIPYNDNIELTELDIPEKKDYVTQICAMHLYASLKGGYLFEDRIYGYDELAELSPDIFVLGHYHLDQGVYKESDKYFINIGSLSRGTIADEDINHHPQIGFIKINVKDNIPTYSIRSIRLNIKPVEEVFNLEKKREIEKEKKEIEAFVDKLASETSAEDIKSSDTIDNLIDKMNITKEIKDRVLNLIQEAAAKK